MPESNTRQYQQDSGAALYRRSMYTFWKRAAPLASMDVLNAPNREFCTMRREQTDTPLQALVTMNDPTFSKPPASWPNTPWAPRTAATMPPSTKWPNDCCYAR